MSKHLWASDAAGDVSIQAQVIGRLGQLSTLRVKGLRNALRENDGPRLSG